MWCYLASAGNNQYVWNLADTGTTNHYMGMRTNTSEIPGCATAAGGTDATAISTVAVVGVWSFWLSRYISTTERRMHVVSSNLIESSASTVSRAPTSLDALTIGARQNSGAVADPWDGPLAEYWLAQGDVFGAGVVPTIAELVAVAYGGPFAHPAINSRLLEYRSFREGLYSRGDIVRHNWSTVNGPLVGPHPPLPYWYERPGQVRELLVV
jgi:hypothetical protein